MAKIETLYVSDDGKKKFKTELEADGYNLFKKLEPSIEQYIAETKAPKATAGLLRKQLPGYVAFVQSQGGSFSLPEAPAVAVAETVAEASVHDEVTDTEAHAG